MASIMQLVGDTVVLEPDDGYPLHITAKQYSPTKRASESGEYTADTGALTLIFLHSTSFHKETWEPTLQTLFERLQSCAGSIPLVDEAWAVECPNHGASAVLNEKALQLPEFHEKFTCEKYALAVHRFLSADPDRGAKVDFRSRRLVGIGHSLGGVAMTILQQLDPKIPFESVILVEPMLSPKGPEPLRALRNDLVRGAYERRDVWPNRQDAHDALKQRNRTRQWDPRSLDVFVKYALRTHPGARHAEAPYNGLTLCCSREQEAAMYREVDALTKPMPDLNAACARIPIHIVFGDVNDYIPRGVQDALVDSSSPRRFASITYLKHTGHLVPQQAPDSLAQITLSILQGIPSRNASRNIRPKM